MGAMSGAGSLGRFIGPFTAGTLLWVFPGEYRYAFWLAAVIMAAAAVTLLKIRPVAPGKIAVE
jgi:MFS family permease